MFKFTAFRPKMSIPMSKPRLALGFLLFAILFISSCAPVDSLNPLYTEKDVVQDAALVGDWISTDPSETDKDGMKIIQMRYVDDRADENIDGYEITLGGATFRARLVEIQGHRFLDLVPQEWGARYETYTLHLSQSKNGTVIEPHLLKLGMAAYMEFGASGKNSDGQVQANLRPAHWFFKVTLDGKKLQLDHIDDEKFRGAVEQGKVHLGNVLLGAGKKKDVVITATTQELQTFVVEHFDDEKLFSEHVEFQRKQVP
jgi:hypothetical protein